MRRNSHGKKAQAWYLDFILGTIIFTVALILYFVYLPNLDNQELNDLDAITLDSQFLVRSLMSPGYPENWTSSSVIKIGVIENSTYLNATKVYEFKTLTDSSYDRARNLLGITSDFVLFFMDQEGDLVPIQGVYIIGNGDVNYTTNNVTLAYYNQGGSETEMYDEFINNTLYIDVDEHDTSAADSLDTIGSYDAVLMESPVLSDGAYPNQQDQIEAYVASGGVAFISDRIANNDGLILGVAFERGTPGNHTATILKKDSYFWFETGESLNCYEDNAIESTGDPLLSNFEALATYDETGEVAFARWNYENGTVYYFCDFETLLNDALTYDSFTAQTEEGIEIFIQKNLLFANVSLTGISGYNNLVRINRIVSYQGNPLGIVIYLWDS